MCLKKKMSLVGVALLVLMLASLLFGVFYQSGSMVLGRKQNPVPAGLVINEVMADNDATIAGPQGTYPDWIELYNASNETIKLSGMYLTDNLSYPKEWRFPKNTTMAPGSYLVIWADNSVDGAGELHVSFALGANVGTIGLFASDGETLIDSVLLGKQLRDVSYGRIPDGGSDWQYLTMPTPNAANQANATMQAPAAIWSIVLIAILITTVIAIIVIWGKITLKRRQHEPNQ